MSPAWAAGVVGGFAIGTLIIQLLMWVEGRVLHWWDERHPPEDHKQALIQKMKDENR